MKILLVDDDPAIRLVASMALSRLGRHDVREAEDASGALAALAAERPDAVLLDYMLPDADGAELLGRMRDLSDQDLPPVVFLTAKDDPATVDRLIGLGARGVIAKPFDPTTLPGRLVAILAGAAPRS